MEPETGSLFPLEQGMTWTFRIIDSEGGRMDVITRVDRREGEVAHLVSGSTHYAYELRDDGIYRPSIDTYLLKEPVEAGMSWTGGEGYRVIVVAVGQRVEVPAGTFRGCVVIEEMLGDIEVRQVHTLCPGVGPVRIEQFMNQDLVAQGELIGFGLSTDPDQWQ